MGSVKKNGPKYSYEEALHRIASLCSMTEKSEYDARAKLATWQMPQSDINRIVTHLKREGFINDARFAEAFARDKSRFSKWGKVKISLALRQKGIDEQLISSAIDNLNDDEYEDRLLTLLTAKAKTIKAETDYERNGKLIRFALSRGFEFDAISAALKKLK